MPLVTGLMNYLVPLQIGARACLPVQQPASDDHRRRGAGDAVAETFGEFAATGWLAYPPLSASG